MHKATAWYELSNQEMAHAVSLTWSQVLVSGGFSASPSSASFPASPCGCPCAGAAFCAAVVALRAPGFEPASTGMPHQCQQGYTSEAIGWSQLSAVIMCLSSIPSPLKPCLRPFIANLERTHIQERDLHCSGHVHCHMLHVQKEGRRSRTIKGFGLLSQSECWDRLDHSHRDLSTQRSLGCPRNAARWVAGSLLNSTRSCQR